VVDPRGVGVTLTSRHKRLLASRAANRAMITETWLGVSPLARQLAREWETFAPARADHVKALFDESLMSDASVRELIRTCSAVVGLHPDQATGAIVDCGLVMNKPWAVVPCCVFPSRYPHRLDQSGKTARHDWSAGGAPDGKGGGDEAMHAAVRGRERCGVVETAGWIHEA
jgi:hypothetical protein